MAKAEQNKNILDLINEEIGMDADSVLDQIRSNFDAWTTFSKGIKAEFDKELKLYWNNKKKKHKIGDHTIFNVHSALMARSYVDRPQSKFVSTKIGRDYVVKNLNATLEEDFNSSDMEILKYQRDWDKFLFWVWIVAKTGWCGGTKSPKFEVVDPRNWVPDPNGDHVNGKYSFTWFTKNVFKTDLLAMGLSEEDIEAMPKNPKSDNTSKEKDQRTAGLWNTQSSSSENPSYTLYYAFELFNNDGKMIKALVITDRNQTMAIGGKVYEWQTKAEKKNATLIPFPFAFTYWKPRSHNPFGDRIGTYIWDIQRIKAEMINLRLDKSKAELYPMYLYNTRLIKNKSDLDFGFNKLVAANPLEAENLNNAVKPLQRDFRADNSYIIEDSLDSSVERTTSVGKVTQGSLPSRRETAKTNNLVQDNTDINLALAGKIESWGEKQLIKLWLRWYMEKFAEWDRKIVNFNTWFSIFPKELKRKDFLSETSVRIQVITIAELDKKKDKERLAYTNSLPMLQMLQRPKAAENFSYRRYLASQGIPENQIEIEVPRTPQEIIAMENVELLIAWKFVEVESDYEPLTHLIAIKSAPQELNTLMYRKGLLELYKAQWWANPESMTQVADGLVNNAAAQSSAQAANESSSLLSN